MLYFQNVAAPKILKVLALQSRPMVHPVQFSLTSGSAMAEGPREALVSRNPAITKHLI